jgi:hypothetical protein
MHLYICLLFLKALIYHPRFLRLHIPREMALLVPSSTYMTVVTWPVTALTATYMTVVTWKVTALTATFSVFHKPILVMRRNNTDALWMTISINKSFYISWPPLWSSGQSSWLQIRRLGFDSRHYQKKINGSGTGSTQPREYNWGATW